MNTQRDSDIRWWKQSHAAKTDLDNKIDVVKRTHLEYPLENLGPERFQHFCQALIAREFPKVQCFPVGQPDGGRDALSYYFEDSGDKFIVFQVKFARNPFADVDPHKWLVAIMEGEQPHFTAYSGKTSRSVCSDI